MIFVGLGNPGLEYSETRHNVGFKVIEKLKKESKVLEIYKKKFYNAWKVEIENKEVILIKPKTFMNESGKAVKAAIDFFNENIGDLFVIHDDLDIKIGKIKIIKDKGPAGHKGVISVIENVGSNEFFRIRIGIRGEMVEKSYIEYVLSPFLSEEKEIIEKAIEKAVNAIREILRSNVEKAMSLYNN